MDWSRNDPDRWRADGAEVWFDGRPDHSVWRGHYADKSGRWIPVSISRSAEDAMAACERALPHAGINQVSTPSAAAVMDQITGRRTS